jgi:hypothetical protein
MKTAAARSAVLFLLLAGCATHPHQRLTCDLQPGPNQSKDMRDRRYCEILALQGTGERLTGCVYNTITLNDCPPARWSALDAATLRREFKVSEMILNGPRHFMMDRFITLESGTEKVDFDGVWMMSSAVIDLPPGGLLLARHPRFYEPTEVERRTEFIYSAGMPVYELLDRDGNTYVMQSYSQIVDPTLTAGDLPTLGRRLKLPDGWKYETRIPKSDLTLRSGGTAYVIQDELQDTYQRLDPSP